MGKACSTIFPIGDRKDTWYGEGGVRNIKGADRGSGEVEGYQEY